MHIVHAYCVEAGCVFDIYRARAFFYALDEPRRRLTFLCSDDRCRKQNATKVTGVNYDKLVERGDSFVLKPHFRANADSEHLATCEWSVSASRGEGEPGRAGVAGHRGRSVDSGHAKTTDWIDVFFPTQARTTGRVSNQQSVASVAKIVPGA